MNGWISIKEQKPNKDEHKRVLACDQFGYVSIEETADVHNIHVGKMTWLQSNKYGNGTRIVAWMPMPKWPAHLCRKDADGEMT